MHDEITYMYFKFFAHFPICRYLAAFLLEFIIQNILYYDHLLGFFFKKSVEAAKIQEKNKNVQR